MNPTRAPSLSAVILPREHGSWSLAFEPVLLFLLVAPSRPGFALAFATAAGFFTRRPLKLAVTLPATDPRRAPACTAAVIFALLAVAGLTATAALGSTRQLWPLLLAVPLGGLFLWFDLRNAMREAEAELAGSAAFALLPAAGATLAGWPASASLALAALSLARSVPTVLTVRTYLRLAKAQSVSIWPALAGVSLALLGIALLFVYQLVPWVGVAVNGVFCLRSAWLLSPVRPHWTARRLGVVEAVLGSLFLGFITASYNLC